MILFHETSLVKLIEFKINSSMSAKVDIFNVIRKSQDTHMYQTSQYYNRMCVI